MTRIYEALVLAQQETIVETHANALVKTSKELDAVVYEKLLFMHERISEKKSTGKYIHFIGMSNSHDERSLINLYARMLSGNMKKKVALCLDTEKNKKQTNHANHFDTNESQGYLHEMDKEFVEGLLEKARYNNKIDDRNDDMDFYDSIILYSSTKNSLLLPLLLTKVVSDTVLIFNSETIKYGEVEKYIKKIKLSDGNLLGIVMNKMVPYIPQTIEKYL